MARQTVRKPHETVPFVSDTVRFSPLSLPVGGNPTQARPTPLPKPKVDLKRKNKRESSLLNLLPRFGRKEESATTLREPTLEVSDQDISILDSCTQELSLDDMSLVDAPPSSLPPPVPVRTPRRQSPWLMWGLVGAGWCVMIAFALFAVEPEASNVPSKASLVPPVGTASIQERAVDANTSTRVVAPTVNTAAESAKKTAAASTAAPEKSRKASVGALVGDPEQKLKSARNSREKRAHKRVKHKDKHKGAVSKKNKRAKKVRAPRTKTSERG